MLYNWFGKPYRSKQIDVAPVMVHWVRPLQIHQCPDGEMFYSCIEFPGCRRLYETEGFESEWEMDEWFRKVVKPGDFSTKFLMSFELI